MGSQYAYLRLPLVQGILKDEVRRAIPVTWNYDGANYAVFRHMSKSQLIRIHGYKQGSSYALLWHSYAA